MSEVGDYAEGAQSKKRNANFFFIFPKRSFPLTTIIMRLSVARISMERNLNKTSYFSRRNPTRPPESLLPGKLARLGCDG